MSCSLSFSFPYMTDMSTRCDGCDSYSSAMVKLLETPVSLAAVRIHGANTTTRTFLDWLIAPHIVLVPHSTFQNVLDTTTAISRALTATGLFRAHSVRIQPAENGSDAHVDLVYDVHERGRFFIKTSTELGDGEGNAASTYPLLSLSAHSLCPSHSRVVSPTSSAMQTSFPSMPPWGPKPNARSTRLCPFPSPPQCPLTPFSA